MSQRTILVIDDSSTIRRLVDSHLSQAGYRVVLAASAEEGLLLAGEVNPDLILLDHQLPGTTGCEVCRQLIKSPKHVSTPVIVTSTLRKRAYADYMEIANVVDSLPKPFTPDLLLMSIANALETGSLVVTSQAQGTAVPEVIQAVGDTALSGSLASFGLREVLDFLNNGLKRGALEVELARERIWFYLERGRIQAVLGSAIDPLTIAATLPETLRDLAPVLNFTVAGCSHQHLDSLVELLDKKVLDPRLLRSLLRHQAAMLTLRCFSGDRKAFHFEAERGAPALFRKLTLDISLAALLVEGALVCAEGELPPLGERTTFVRRGLRGQNLDRTGLSAHHMKVVASLDQPLSLDSLAEQLELDRSELRRVLHGLVLAEWVEAQAHGQARVVIALETDPAGAQQLRELLARDPARYRGKVVRDRLGVQLLLKRTRPDVLALALDQDDQRKLAGELRRAEELKACKFIGIVPAAGQPAGGLGFNSETARLNFDALLERPYSEEDLLAALERLATPWEQLGRDAASSGETAPVGLDDKAAALH